MEKLTIEKKAKRYDKAIERAEGLIDFCSDSELKTLEYVFPELKESEDEKIRKELIEHCKNQAKPYIDTGNECPQIQSWIAWLEKQGEPKSYGQREECIDCQFNYAGECKGFCTMKRSERKPADKVKPKFKISNWIINRTGATIMQIVNNEDFYESVEIGGQRRTDTYNYVERDFRLWSIEDAKDGDVLADEYGIYIFNSFDSSDDKLFICKCAYEYSKKTFEFGEMLCKKTDVYPASKDQRDLLFQKMHEAGYMWDSKSKQLLSLKAEPSDIQTPTGWSEEDEEILRSIIATCELAEADRDSSPARHLLEMQLNWLKSIKPQKHWKPNEKQIKALHDMNLTGNISYAGQGQVLIELYNDLKKL